MIAQSAFYGAQSVEIRVAKGELLQPDRLVVTIRRADGEFYIDVFGDPVTRKAPSIYLEPDEPGKKRISILPGVEG